MRKLQPAALVLLLAALALGACGGGPKADLATFCEKLGVAFGPEGAIASLPPNGTGSAEAVTDEMDALSQVAPLEIEPSLAVVKDTVSLLITAFSSPDETGQETLQGMRSEMAAYEEAAGELALFSANHCDLALDWESPALAIDTNRITGEVQLDVEG